MTSRRQANRKQKNSNSSRKITLFENKLDIFCKNNELFDFNFTSCKLISNSGIVNDIDYNQFKANARNGFILLNIKNIVAISGSKYDIVSIKESIIERDKNTSTFHADNENHTQILTNLEKAANMSPKINIRQDSNISTESKDTIDETIPCLNKPENSDNMNNQSTKKGNKHYRRFIKNLKTNFKISKINDYKYFETKLNSTQIVIDQPDMYKLIDIFDDKATFYVIIGEFKIKNQYIKTIDKDYDKNSVVENQSDFMEKIKLQEQENTTQHVHSMQNNELAN